MYSVNKYEPGFSQLGSSRPPKETNTTSFNRSYAGMRYQINGGGRDTYIYNDNGGFASMHRARMQDQPGTFLPRVNRSPNAAQKYTTANQNAKSVRYKTDGTGRDSYCHIGDGGFSNPNKAVALDPRVAFARSLRGYGQDENYLARRNRRLQMKINRRHHSNYMNTSNDDVASGRAPVTCNDMNKTTYVEKKLVSSMEPTSAHKRYTSSLVNVEPVSRNDVQASPNSKKLRNTSHQLDPVQEHNLIEFSNSFALGGQRGSELQVQKKNWQMQNRERTKTTTLSPMADAANNRSNRDDGGRTFGTGYETGSTMLKPSDLQRRTNMQRVHRNSIERSPIIREKPPALPAQNPKQEQLNILAKYLSRLDSRLSQPKLQSPVRTSLQVSQRSLNRSIENPSPTSPTSPGRQRGTLRETTQADSLSAFEKHKKSEVVRNNSMVDLRDELLGKIAKPTGIMRNSMNGGIWETAVSQPPKTYDTGLQGSTALLKRKNNGFSSLNSPGKQLQQ